MEVSQSSTESFTAFGPESQPGGRVLDLFEDRITTHRPPRAGSDEYSSYMKDLDQALAAAEADSDCLVVSSDVLVPKLATVQASAAALVFWGGQEVKQVVSAA